MDQISDELRGYLDRICKDLQYANSFDEFRRLYSKESGYNITPTKDAIKTVIQKLLHHPLVKRKYGIIEDIVVVFTLIHFGISCELKEGNGMSINYTDTLDGIPGPHDKFHLSRLRSDIMQVHSFSLTYYRTLGSAETYRQWLD